MQLPDQPPADLDVALRLCLLVAPLPPRVTDALDPRRDHAVGHEPHLGPPRRLRQIAQEDILDQDLGGRHPGAGGPGRLHHRGDLRLVHLRDQVVTEERGRPGRLCAVGQNGLHVAVDVLDGDLAGLQRVQEPHVRRDVPGEGDPLRPGGGGDLVVGAAGDPGVDLEQVVSRGALLGDPVPGRLLVRHAVPVQRGARGEDLWTQPLAVGHLRPQLQVVRVPQHAADRRDPVGQEEEEHPVDRLLTRLGRRDVRVHLAEPGDEVAGAPVHPGRSLGYGHGSRRSHLVDPSSHHDYRLALEHHPVAGHGDHVHPLERHRGRRLLLPRERRWDGEEWEEQGSGQAKDAGSSHW